MSAFAYARAAADAWRGDVIRLAGRELRVPGSRAIRLAVVGGNIRIHRLIDALAAPAACVIDVGANVGFNTVYAACHVGPRGRVVAVEPAPDNMSLLQRNVAAARLENVTIAPVAAGGASRMGDLYLRGDASAVNSLYPQSCYAAVTGTVKVSVRRLDDIVEGDADLVKIDVEGAELEVLDGMPRLLRAPRLALIVEWHPTLQEMAGHARDALPLRLIEGGWRLHAASHVSIRPLEAPDVPVLGARLARSGRSVEIVAQRA